MESLAPEDWDMESQIHQIQEKIYTFPCQARQAVIKEKTKKL